MLRTLLARTFLLTAGLVLLTTVAWLAIFNFYEAEPRARQTAELTASAVNTVRAALVAADPSKRLGLLNELSHREGIRLLPADPADQLETLPDGRYWRLLKAQIQWLLGPNTRVAYGVDDVPGLWVSFRFDDEANNVEDEEFWVILPRERAMQEVATSWLLWGALALALSLAVAGFMANRLARPMKALAHAAKALGRGQQPAPLPEQGPEELQQLSATFNRMAADLAAHEAERAEVLAGISHDLRTPLTRLRLEAEMSIANPEARDAAAADIEQMESVISQFLDYARGDAGEAETEIAPAGLLQALLERQRTLGRSITANMEELPSCAIRPKALQRAVTNLIENAYKYGAEPVELVARAEKNMLIIDIMDRGSGIPEQETERLKRPFTQLENARTDAKGTGLGLAIVDRIARQHGGHFDLLQRLGGGLIARLAIPLKA